MWKQKLVSLAMVLTFVAGAEQTVAGDDAPQSFASKRRLFEEKAKQNAQPPIVKRGLPKTPVTPEPTPEIKAEPNPEPASEPTPEGKPEPTPKPTLTGVPKVAGPKGTAITPDIIPGEAAQVKPETAESKKPSGWLKGTAPKTTEKNIKTTDKTKTKQTTERKEAAHDCSKCSEEDCKTNKGRYEFCKLCHDVSIDKCLEGATNAGFINKKADFERMNALSDGKGIKAKDVLPRFTSIENIMKDLHGRISHLKNNKKAFLKKERDLVDSINFIKEKTGLKKSNINPEEELKNYDSVLMASISAGVSGLSVEICEVLVKDFDRKVESNFKSLVSKTQRFVNSQTKRQQEDKLKQLKAAGSKMGDECKSWKLKTQLAGQEKKDVYEVLQGLWKEMDAQLQDAQSLLVSKH